MKNNKVYIYYVLLGVGIGLVLGSIINIVTPAVKVKEYTDEEIVQKARELGMHSLDEIIEKNNELKEEDKQNVENQNADNLQANINENTLKEEKQDTNKVKTIEYVEFTVEKGDSSEEVIDNLFKANIIDSKEEFAKVVVRRKIGRRIHFGKFDIPLGSDYDTIIDILTK